MTRHVGRSRAVILVVAAMLSAATGCTSADISAGGNISAVASLTTVQPTSRPGLPSRSTVPSTGHGRPTASTTSPSPLTRTPGRTSKVPRPTTTALSPTSRSPRLTSSPTRPPGFVAATAPIDAALAARMHTSWRPGCPVPLSDLSYLRVTYRGFDGAVHLGEMVVATSVAAQITGVFRLLFRQRYPIRSMRLVDDFGGSDDASMTADNTSAFNCRPSTGGSTFSQHSYGAAVDVNPVENPYVGGGQVLPPAGSAYARRPDVAGVIHDGDAVVAAFGSVGWTWGGDWSGPRDYQHFSANGR